MSLTLLKKQQKELILSTLRNCDGNLSQTARQLGIGRTTLYRLMRKYHISIERTAVIENMESIDETRNGS